MCNIYVTGILSLSRRHLWIMDVSWSLVAGAVDHLSEQRGAAARCHVDEGESAAVAAAGVAHL